LFILISPSLSVIFHYFHYTTCENELTLFPFIFPEIVGLVIEMEAFSSRAAQTVKNTKIFGVFT